MREVIYLKPSGYATVRSTGFTGSVLSVMFDFIKHKARIRESNA